MAHAYTDDYREAVEDGGRLVTRVDVLSPQGLQLATTGLPGQNLGGAIPLLVNGGSISMSASGAFRRSLRDLVLLDPDRTFVPTDGNALFSPLSGNEIRVWSGRQTRYVTSVPFQEGDFEVFPVGTFPIVSAVTDDVPAGTTITISGVDRARKLARNKFTKPFVIVKDLPFLSALLLLMGDRWPDFATLPPIYGEPTGFLCDRLVIDVQADPWEQMQKLAESFGYEVFFDGLGSMSIRPVPDPRDPLAPVQWRYVEGETSSLLKVQRSQSSDDSPNGIIVTGQGTSGVSPPRGEAWDTNPASPTYYLGPYGKVPEFVTDARVRLNAQAQASAQGRLNAKLGAAEIVTTDVMPNAALQPNDIVAIQRASSLLDSTFALDTLTLPLRGEGAPTMPIACRERRI